MPMPNRPKYNESEEYQDFVNETHDIFRTYSTERDNWAKGGTGLSKIDLGY